MNGQCGTSVSLILSAVVIVFLMMASPAIVTAECSNPDPIPHEKHPSPPQWKIDGLIAALEDSCEDTRMGAVNDLNYLIYDTEFPVEIFKLQHVRAIALFLKSQNLNDRASAALILGRIGKPAVPIIEEIIPLLSDDEFDVGKAAAEALGRFCADVEPFIPDIVKSLKDGRPNVRELVLRALGNIGEHAKPAIPDIALVLNDTVPFVRHAALETLVKTCSDVSREFIPAVGPFLKANSKYTRALAVKFLGLMGRDAKAYDIEIAGLLKQDNQNEYNYEMTVSIAGALEQIGVYDSLLLSGLVGMLQDSSGDVRLATSMVFRKIGKNTSEILPQIVSLLDNRSPGVRKTALYALWGFGSNARFYCSRIAGLLGDSNAEVRNTAVVTLGKQGDSALQFIPEIVKLLADISASVRKSAVYTLDSLMDSSITSYTSEIADLLDDKDPNVRVAAAMTLARMSTYVQQYIPKMVPLLVDQIFDVQGSGTIAAALALMGEYAESAVPLIINLHRNGQLNKGRTRSTLIGMEKALPKHIPLFAAMLQDTSPGSRFLAVEVLGSRGEQSREFAPAIAVLLSDSDRDVRAAAVRALKKIGGTAVTEDIPIFAVMLNDRAKNVQMEACGALSGSGAAVKPVLPFVISLLSDTTREYGVYPVLENACQFDLPLVCRILNLNLEHHIYNMRLLAHVTAGSDQGNQNLVNMLGNPCSTPGYSSKDTVECNQTLVLLKKTLHVCDSLHLQNLYDEAQGAVSKVTNRKKILCRPNNYNVGLFDRIRLFFSQK